MINSCVSVSACMYAVLNMGYTPSQFISLSRKDRNFIIACIQIKLDEEEKGRKKAERKGGR